MNKKVRYYTVLCTLVLLIALVTIGQAVNTHKVYLPIVYKQTTPRPTSTPTNTPRPSPTSTSTPTNTPLPTNTPTITLTPTITNTPTITLTPTITNTPTITLTPTKTSTPTKTPLPTNTPIPTATPKPQGIYIEDNHTSFTGSLGTLYIVGEVYNGSADYLWFVSVSVDLYNNGQLVDVDSGYLSTHSLAPNTKGCFKIMVIDPPTWNSYTLHSLTYWDDADPPPNLTLYNHSGSYDSYWGDYEIIGQMRNDDSVLVKFAKAIATLYNAQGKVVECDHGYGSDWDLDPGQVTSFKIWSLSRDDYADVASYALVSDGMKQSKAEVSLIEMLDV